ncbi:MAG: sugar phosphate nucleotidyltransferase [archaeon]
MKKKISITINSETLDEIDSIVDYIFIRNRSQAMEHLIRNSLGKNKIAAILAGGPEERMMISDGLYSPAAKISGISVAELAVRKLREDGFRKVFVVARERILTRIFEILKNGSQHGVDMEYVEETQSLGTANSLRLLKGRIGGNFLVVYGDIVFNNINIEELWNDHMRNSAVATLMLTTSATPSEKGTVRMEGSRILSFVQKPRMSDHYLVFSPIFAADADIFNLDGATLEGDVFPHLAEKGLLCGHISSEKERHVHSESDLRAKQK